MVKQEFTAIPGIIDTIPKSVFLSGKAAEKLSSFPRFADETSIGCSAVSK
jgi:hypothetical protein